MGTRVYIEVPEVREATGRGRSPFFRNSQSKVEVIIFTSTLALRLVHFDQNLCVTAQQKLFKRQ